MPRNVKNCQQHKQLRERHGTDSPSKLGEGINLADNRFHTSSLQDCERIILLFVRICSHSPRKQIQKARGTRQQRSIRFNIGTILFTKYKATSLLLKSHDLQIHIKMNYQISSIWNQGGKVGSAAGERQVAAHFIHSSSEPLVLLLNGFRKQVRQDDKSVAKFQCAMIV